MTDLLLFVFGLTTGLLIKSLIHNALTSAIFKFMNSASEETKEKYKNVLTEKLKEKMNGAKKQTVND